MSDRGHIEKLARIIAERQGVPPKLTGSSTAIDTDVATRINTLPLPIGDPGQILTVIDDAGDIVPSWEDAPPGFTEPDLDAIHVARSSFVDTSGGNQTVTLPTAVGIAGRRYVVKKTTGDANTVTVATTSSQTIDGASTYVISAQWAVGVFQSNNADWMIVGEMI